MTETYSTELYRQEGDNFRSVRLYVNVDGSIKLDTQDMGTSVKKLGAIAIMNSGSIFRPQRFPN